MQESLQLRRVDAGKNDPLDGFQYVLGACPGRILKIGAAGDSVTKDRVRCLQGSLAIFSAPRASIAWSQLITEGIADLAGLLRTALDRELAAVRDSSLLIWNALSITSGWDTSGWVTIHPECGKPLLTLPRCAHWPVNVANQIEE